MEKRLLLSFSIIIIHILISVFMENSLTTFLPYNLISENVDVFEDDNNPIYHPIYCSMVSNSICASVFISKRTPDRNAPFLEELSEIAGNVTVQIDHSQKLVIARSIRFPYISRTAVFLDFFRGCIVQDQKVIPNNKKNNSKIKFPPKIRISGDHQQSSVTINIPRQINPRAQKLIEDHFSVPQYGARSILVYQKGYVVAEKHAPGFDVDMPQHGWSLTKSLLCTLFGILNYERKLRVDELINAPEWRHPSPDEDPRSKLTINHLLQMSSGLNFSEIYGYKSDPAQMFYNSSNCAAFAASKSLRTDPGTKFYYSSGDSNILSRKLRDYFSSDDQYWKFPREKLFGPLGMSTTSAVIGVDPSMTFVGGAFGYLSANDWLLFGLLYLNKGVNQRGERLISEEWVSYVSRATSQSGNGYGAHFWLPRVNGVPFMFSAVGYDGQRVVIIPSLQIVIVRLALTKGSWNEPEFYRGLVKVFQQ